MKSRISRVSFALLSGFAVLTAPALILGGLAFWIALQPVTLQPFLPVIGQSISAAAGGWRVRVGSAQAAWSPTQGAFVLRLQNVSLHSPAAPGPGHIDQIDIGFHAPSLLRARLEPAWVDLSGLFLFIRRLPEGQFDLALRFSEDDQAAVPLLSPDGLLRGLLEDQARSPLLRLKRLSFTNAAFGIVDSVNNVTMRARNASFVFARGNGSVTGRLEAALNAGDRSWRLRINSALRLREDGRIRLKASLAGLPIQGFTPIFSELADVVSLNMNVDGDIILDFSHEGYLLHGDASLTAREGGLIFPLLSANATPLRDARLRMRFDAEHRVIDLRSFSYEAFGARAKAAARFSYGIGPDGRLSRFTLRAHGDTLRLKTNQAPLAVRTASLAAHLEPNDNSIHLDSINLALEEGGEIRLKGRTGGASSPSAYRIEGEARDIPLALLSSFIPPQYAPMSHSWSADNLKSGMMKSLLFHLSGSEDADPHLGLTFLFEEAGFTYHPSMTPIEGARGRCTLRQSRFFCDLENARIRNPAPARGLIRLEDLSFQIPDTRVLEPIGTISLSARASVPAALGWLNQPPLRLLERRRIPAASFGGEAALEGDIETSLTGRSWVNFNLRARFDDLSLSGLLPPALAAEKSRMTLSRKEGRFLAQGRLFLPSLPLSFTWKEGSRETPPLELLVTARPRGELLPPQKTFPWLESEGEAEASLRLWGAGGQFSKGRFEMDLSGMGFNQEDLGWRKEKGAAGSLSFDLRFGGEGKGGLIDLSAVHLESGDFSAEGSLSLGLDGSVAGADFPHIGNVSLVALREEDGGLVIGMRTDRFDLRPMIDRFFSLLGSETSAQEESYTAFFLNARAGEAVAHNGVVLDDLSLRLSRGVDGRFEALRFDTHLKGSAGETPLSVSLARQDEDGRRLTIRTDDAGLLLEGLGAPIKVRGGSFLLRADLGELVAGQVFVRDFRLFDAPLAARILSLASLTGILDTLSGEGIHFRGLDADFSAESDLIRLTRAKASGAALGLTLEGVLGLADEGGSVRLRGALTPAHDLNTIPGKIPLIGPLLSGREGDGLFAIPFAISGERDAPDIRVNPAGLIAPGIFRRLFEIPEQNQPG